MNATGLFKKVDTIILRVADLNAAREWYRDKLGVREHFRDQKENLAIVTVGGDTSLTLWQLKLGEQPIHADRAGSYPILMSDDIRNAHRMLRDRGVKVEPVQSCGSTLWFAFYDLDGNRIEVCEVFA